MESLDEKPNPAELYYVAVELQEYFKRFITYFSHERYYESLDNLLPTDVYYGRCQEILERRQAIKLDTLAMRRKMDYDNCNNLNLMS
jgi:hypothetical protein